MYFVDQVDLEATARRRILHIVEQIPRIVDFGLGGCVDLDQIDKSAFVNLPTRTAFAAWRRGDAGLAIECFGQDPCNCGLANTARSREQIRVVQAAGLQRVDQGLQHVLLTNRVGKVFRPPFAGQNEIGHR